MHDVGIEGDTLFIVTELIDGGSLRAIIQRGPLGIRMILDLAVQMADGLAAAHAAGIVHRDLKPENVMITSDGRVKILDFGIAKPFARVIGQSEVTVSVSAATEPGVVLGTVSYLSPEQARGLNELDGRSDQFSFGLMLYELVAGSRAFDRPSGAETIAAVIRDETPPLATSVPFPFRLTIERCLAKEPTHRYENTRDLFLELKHLRDHAPDIATGPQVAIGAIETRVRQRSTMWLWLALVALILAVGIYLARKTAAPTFQRLTYRRGDISGARFSPDGQTILFSAQWSNQPTAIFSMRLGNREFRPLDLPEAGSFPLAPRGKSPSYWAARPVALRGHLARVPLSGGAPREILENVNDADWSPDGANLAVSHTGRRNRIEYPIGTLLDESDGRAPPFLRVSPQGDSLAFFEYDNAVGDFAVAVVDFAVRSESYPEAGRRYLVWPGPKGG